MKKSSKFKVQSSKFDIDIDHVAKLANLPLTADEKKKFEKQLTDILGYVSKLGEVDTQEVEPIGHITGLENVTREDEAAPSLSQEEVLANAPKTHNGYFEVEAILDND